MNRNRAQTNPSMASGQSSLPNALPRKLLLLMALLAYVLPLSRARGQAAPLINPAGPASADAPVDLPPNATVDQVLDALDARGRSLREFTAVVSITEGDPDVGNVTVRSGHVWFQKKGEDDGRIRVTFDKVVRGRIVFNNEKVEYLLDNGWLIDRNYKAKSETRRQVLRPGEKMNLLKLGEGPFPLPIGQRKEEVHHQFDVKLLSADAADGKDLAGMIHVQLKPKKGMQFARKFGLIDVWINRAISFPAQISTDTPDQSDPKITRLQDVQINPAGGLKEADFTLPKVDPQEWNFHTEPFGQ